LCKMFSRKQRGFGRIFESFGFVNNWISMFCNFDIEIILKQIEKKLVLHVFYY
jgi:hypothetical protein